MMTLTDVGKSFQSNESGEPDIVALEGVDLVIPQGEFVSIIGPSGCGKSTMLELMAGLQTPTSGVIEVDGQRLRGPRVEVGVVFQDDATFPWLTAQQNVEFGLEFTGNRDKRKRAKMARETLELVGLASFEKHYPNQLSGGMRQRVNIARVLAAVPKVVLMDEPFGALDEQTRIILGDQLLDIWRRTGATIVFITHSLNEAAMLSDRVVVLSTRPGRIRAVIDSTLPKDRTAAVMGTEPFNAVAGKLWELLEDDLRSAPGSQ